jgi:hypothetical protein
MLSLAIGNRHKFSTARSIVQVVHLTTQGSSMLHVLLLLSMSAFSWFGIGEGPSSSAANKIPQYCIVAGHLSELIDGYPCGYIIDEYDTVRLDPVIKGTCNEPNTIQCNPEIFGNNNKCVKLPSIEEVSPSSTEACRSLLARGDQNMVARQETDLLMIQDAEAFREKAFNLAEEALAKSKCERFFGRDRSHWAYQTDDLVARNLSRECSSMKSTWTNLSKSNCMHDREAIQIFRRVVSKGKVRLSQLSGNGRWNFSKEYVLEDFLPGSDGKKPLVQFSNIPYCQASLMMQLKQARYLLSLAPPTEEDQIPRFMHAPLPRSKPRNLQRTAPVMVAVNQNPTERLATPSTKAPAIVAKQKSATPAQVPPGNVAAYSPNALKQAPQIQPSTPQAPLPQVLPGHNLPQSAPVQNQVESAPVQKQSKDKPLLERIGNFLGISEDDEADQQALQAEEPVQSKDSNPPSKSAAESDEDVFTPFSCPKGFTGGPNRSCVKVAD